MDAGTESIILSQLHDRMTEQRYLRPLTSFDTTVPKNDWFEVDIMNKGTDALREIDRRLGLAFDEQDIVYYTHLFKDVLKRNPTSVECFDLAQSNSEHSRHWFFRVSTSCLLYKYSFTSSCLQDLNFPCTLTFFIDGMLLT